MKSRIKFTFLPVIISLILIMLSGCTLAQPEQTPPDGKLVGVLVNAVPENGIDPLTALVDPVTGRLEAKTRQREDDGIISTEYYFDEDAGIPLFCPTVHDEDGDYSGVITDDRVCGVNLSINESDYSRSKSISGKIYVDDSGEKLYALDPVYQREDGSVYAVPSDGGWLSTGSSGADTFSLSLDEKYTETENGRKSEQGSSVRVDIELRPVPVTVGVYEMDGTNSVVSENQYNAGDVPESITTSAQWLLTATTNIDGSVTREVWSREDESFTTLVPDNSGVMKNRVTEITWQ